jgi:hypothetical protein
VPLTHLTKNRRQRVLEAVVLLSSNLGEEEVVWHLTRGQCSALQAWQLVMLIPMAFARVVFEPAGVRFYDHYLAWKKGAAKARRRLLTSEPLYCEAVRLGQRLAATRRLEALYQVVRRSAEYTAIQQLRQSGSDFGNIRLTEPSLVISP